MKQLLIIIFCFISLSLNSATYYVSTTGSDGYPGTIGQPWATWQKAFNTADAGDTVYFRGGIYMPSSKVVPGGYPITRIDPSNGYGNNGTYNDPICFFNYPGEVPILDGSLASSSNEGNIGLNVNNATHIKFRGLTVRNILMLNTTANCSGIESINNAVGVHANLWFENMTVHNVGGAGYWLAGCDTLHVTNCDVYNVCDSLDNWSPGGDGDGFNLTHGGAQADTFKIIYVEGCRAWNCSDDGFDIGGTKQLQVTNSWSFRNGWHSVYSVGYDSTGYYGDGNGFKLASSDVLTTSKRQFKNLIVASNLHFGLSTANLVDEYYGPRGAYYNILSYSNEMCFLEGVGNWDASTGKGQQIYRNVVDYVFSSAYHALPLAAYTGNQFIFTNANWTFKAAWPYWDEAIPVSDADFVSLDTLQLDNARQTDGSLPVITFGTLAATSDLINAGVDVGLPYSGTAPDIGYAEYNEGDPDPPVEAPLVSTGTPNHTNIRGSRGSGIVTSAGGGTISARGICLSTSTAPDLGDTVFSTTGTTGSFTVIITGLSTNTAYHIRAYATNETGTSYGSEVDFTTPKQSVGMSGANVMVSGGNIIMVR